jgi:predicted nucleic acid-binding protein
MTTIVDTDTLIGLTIEADPLHERVARLYINVPHDTTFYLLSDTLSEFATLSTIKIGIDATQRVVSDIVKSHKLITLSPEHALAAVELYQRQTTKENSLFDCSVMVAAGAYEADCIFSFDRGYTQNGLELLEDYLRHAAELEESSGV